MGWEKLPFLYLGILHQNCGDSLPGSGNKEVLGREQET